MTPAEAAARRRKAQRLIAALREHLPQTSNEDLAALVPHVPDALWSDVANLAGVRVPSRETVREVALVLELQIAEDVSLAKNRQRLGMVLSSH